MECILNFLNCIVAKFLVPIHLTFVAVYLTRIQEVIKGCAETSERNYHYMLPISPKERSSQKVKLFQSLYFSGIPKGGGVGGFKPPPPEISKPLQNRAKLSPIVKTAESETPTTQVVWQKSSKIRKLPRFAIVLH